MKPAGDDGTYFENVKLRGYRVTRNSSVTVTATNGQSRTFKHGDHVTFPANSGGRQTLTFDSVEFVGYGQAADYQGRDVKNKLIVWVPNPTAGDGFGRGRGCRSRRHDVWGEGGHRLRERTCAHGRRAVAGAGAGVAAEGH